MPEYYTLVEMKYYQRQTMPPVTDRRPVLLHASLDAEGGIVVACSYQVEVERDVPRRDLAFSAGWKTVVQRAPECRACVVAIATAS
ncbi:hypothetical protein [Catenulispora rubra]|uniref:hypothetical protein n=1 Tax=Catenulispora rubra TaxID=280293 RepID=UPI0018927540|nr:hypothetical protein [Catenulispora rubra]